jgi:methionine-rich copper-binding protein CopC
MRNALAVAILGTALCIAGPAVAHTDLTKSIPAADTTVPSPKIIVLTFSEKVAPAFTGSALTMASGKQYALAIAVSRDGKIVTCTPKGSLMAGTYKLTWHASSVDDGHRTDGSFSFKVK